MCVRGRRRRSCEDASFVINVAFPQHAATWSQGGFGTRREQDRTPNQGHRNLDASLHKLWRRRKRQTASPSLSMHILPISFRTEEDERRAVPLRSLSAPAHSGAIVRAASWVEWRYAASSRGGRGGWVFDRQCTLLAVLVSSSREGSKQRPERQPDELRLFIRPECLHALHCLPGTAKAFSRNT